MVRRSNILMTHKIRLTTGQYEYVELDFEGTGEEALLEYTRLKAIQGGFGLPEKEFNDALDRYLCEGQMDGNVYERMDLSQKTFIQTIKRSINRTKNRNK